MRSRTKHKESVQEGFLSHFAVSRISSWGSSEWANGPQTPSTGLQHPSLNFCHNWSNHRSWKMGVSLWPHGQLKSYQATFFFQQLGAYASTGKTRIVQIEVEHILYSERACFNTMLLLQYKYSKRFASFYGWTMLIAWDLRAVLVDRCPVIRSTT